MTITLDRYLEIIDFLKKNQFIEDRNVIELDKTKVTFIQYKDKVKIRRELDKIFKDLYNLLSKEKLELSFPFFSQNSKIQHTFKILTLQYLKEALNNKNILEDKLKKDFIETAMDIDEELSVISTNLNIEKIIDNTPEESRVSSRFEFQLHDFHTHLIPKFDNLESYVEDDNPFLYINDNIDRCIFISRNNKERKHNKAAILYYLDKFVHLLCVSPYLSEMRVSNDPLAISILIELEPNDLLVDGVVVSKKYLGRIREQMIYNNFMSEFIYKSILKYASMKGYNRLYINESHPDGEEASLKFVDFIREGISKNAKTKSNEFQKEFQKLRFADEELLRSILINKRAQLIPKNYLRLLERGVLEKDLINLKNNYERCIGDLTKEKDSSVSNRNFSYSFDENRRSLPQKLFEIFFKKNKKIRFKEYMDGIIKINNVYEESQKPHKKNIENLESYQRYLKEHNLLIEDPDVANYIMYLRSIILEGKASEDDLKGLVGLTEIARFKNIKEKNYLSNYTYYIKKKREEDFYKRKGILIEDMFQNRDYVQEFYTHTWYPYNKLIEKDEPFWSSCEGPVKCLEINVMEECNRLKIF